MIKVGKQQTDSNRKEVTWATALQNAYARVCSLDDGDVVDMCIGPGKVCSEFGIQVSRLS